MIRLTVFYVVITAGLIYVWKDWFRVMCGMVLLTVLLQRGDMPSQLFGITGANPLNLLLVCITIAWFLERTHSPPQEHIPGKYLLFWGAYAAVLGFACLRAAFDGAGFRGYEQFNSKAALLADWLINPLKFMWLTILFYEGMRTRQRAQLALATILGVGILYGLLVIKYLPFESLIGQGDFMRHRRLIEKQIGLHANDMAKVLVATVWGLVASYGYWKTRKLRWVALGGMGICLVGAALTYSRAGYIALAGVGLGFGLLRYRKILLLMPVAAVIMIMAFPSVADRLSMGFGKQTVAGDSVEDWDTITAGRTTNLWPPVIEGIEASPMIGYGRLAILRTDVYEKIEALEGETPSHPHNAYLEMLLDAGFLGMGVVMACFLGMLYVGIRLLLSRDDLLASAFGGLAVAHVATILITALGGTAFFFTQSSIPPLCCIGMTLRMYHERKLAGLHGGKATAPALAMQRPITPAYGITHA